MSFIKNKKMSRPSKKTLSKRSAKNSESSDEGERQKEILSVETLSPKEVEIGITIPQKVFPNIPGKNTTFNTIISEKNILKRDPTEDAESYKYRVDITKAILETSSASREDAETLGRLAISKLRYNISYNASTEAIITTALKLVNMKS